MGGEGHMLDMIRRLSEGREASRLRRERANNKLKHLNRTNEPYPRKHSIKGIPFNLGTVEVPKLSFVKKSFSI